MTDNSPIPMASLDDALSLFEEIKRKWPEYLQKFYSAAANVVNLTYQEPTTGLVGDDDLPF